jgi:O-antigen/teichoic acid export membrane protein
MLSDEQPLDHGQPLASPHSGAAQPAAQTPSSVDLTRRAAIGGSLLARNTVLNLVGQGLPLLVGVIAIPFTVGGLGVERYGLLSLVWVILGYFTSLDLGLGRATTKYVAEVLGSGQEEQVPRLVWTAVSIQALFGLVGAAVLATITPFLVERILSIPVAVTAEAKSIFYLLALAIPVVFVSSSFAGVLEAAQRFDLLNAVKIPSNLLTFLLPVVGVILGFQLLGIVALMLLARFVACLLLLLLDLRIFPNLKHFSASFALLSRLFAYGGWVTVSNTVTPIFVYADRFMIASLFSISAVAYYTVPYEAVTRLWIVPVSLAMTLFPTFSALEGSGDRQRLGMLYARSVKYTLLAVGPIVLIVVPFAEEILQLWLGSDFSMRSALVLKILALGVLINSVAHTPYALLQGIGRPDITAKFHLLEVPIYVATIWIFLGKWGIAGAAAAWTLRVSLDTLLLFVAAFKVCRVSPRLFTTTNRLMFTSLALLVLSGAAYGLKNLTGDLPLFVRSIVFVTLLGLSAFVVWRNVLDASDRGALVKVIKL